MSFSLGFVGVLVKLIFVCMYKLGCVMFLLCLALHASPAVICKVMELGFVSSGLYQVVLCLFC